MNFFEANLEETVDAINKLIDDKIYTVNAKKIRLRNKIDSSNRSKINFIWRSLDYLEKLGLLELNGAIRPKTYKINSREKIEIDEVISQVIKIRKKNQK